MDQLSYTYTGNRVIGVDDAVDDIANNNRYDFSDNSHQGSVQEGNPGTWEYQYDGNGNMISDANKGVAVSYNFLNLPTKVDFGTGDSIVWIYTVSGAKLRKTVYDNGTVTKTVDYVSGFIYENSHAKFFPTEEGRMKRRSNGAWLFTFDYKDHLGNVRVTYSDSNNDGTAEVLEESAYYPYGMRIEGLSSSNPDNKFTYNGKELEDDHGLNWYHYGARYYDPQVGRWWVVDPADEGLSSYSYAANNAVSTSDIDGKVVLFINGQNNNGANAKYWGHFGQEIMNAFSNEKALFRDGAIGGWANTLFNWLGLHNLIKENRFAAGYAQGIEDAAELFGYMSIEKSNVLRVVTHSMGSAYGRGYVKAVLDHAAENGIKGFKVVEVDVAPYQGANLPAIPGVKTFQMSGDEDFVAGNSQVPGAERIHFQGESEAGHPISDFPGPVAADALDGTQSDGIRR